MTLRHQRQWAAAAWAAMRAHLARHPFSGWITLAWTVAVAACLLLDSRKVDVRLLLRLSRTRLRQCRRCPLFDRAMLTCGTAGHWVGDDYSPAGCWCYLPVATTAVGKHCFRK